MRPDCHCAAVVEMYGCEEMGKDGEWGEGKVEEI